ncbi:MAG: hypothetical protein EXR77_13880 [Myxococcales bacterium]|nr:hypothetical protein [Myxococcales bacterium]
MVKMLGDDGRPCFVHTGALCNCADGKGAETMVEHGNLRSGTAALLSAYGCDNCGAHLVDLGDGVFVAESAR